MARLREDPRPAFSMCFLPVCMYGDKPNAELLEHVRTGRCENSNGCHWRIDAAGELVRDYSVRAI